MDIVCPACKTEYDFDEAQVPSGGVTVQCTNCDHTFRVNSRDIAQDSIDAEAPTTARTMPFASAVAQPKRSQQPWTIRKPSGDLLRFHELATLREWIAQGRVGRQDEISRSGETWKQLGDIPELAASFSSREQIHAEVEQHHRSVPAHDTHTPSSEIEPASIGPLDGDDVREPAFAQLGHQLTSTNEGAAAWERAGVRVAATGAYEQPDIQLPKSHGGRYVGLALLSLLLIAGGAFLALKPWVFKGFFAGLFGGMDTLDAAYARSRELFMRDDPTSLDKADQELAKTGSNATRIRAARAEIYTVWTQYLKDQVAVLTQRVDRLSAQLDTLRAQSGKSHSGGSQRSRKAAVARLDSQITALRQRIDALDDEAARKMEIAQAQLRSASEGDADTAEVYRALADLHRIEGRSDVPTLLARVRSTLPDDPEALHIEGLYWFGKGELDRARKLFESAISQTEARTGHTLLRSAFQLALMDFRSGRAKSALDRIREILADNPRHEWARDLRHWIEVEGTKSASAPATAASDAGRAADDAATTTAAADAAAEAAEAVEPTTQQTSAPTTPRPSEKPKAHSPPVAQRVPTQSYAALIAAGDRASEHGRAVQAMEYYDKAARLKPNGVEAITGLGYCELDLQRFSSALGLFRKALRVAPTYGDAMIGMAEAYMAIGNRSRALDHYKAYLRTHPSGRKASIAQRNVRELEAELGAPAPSGQPRVPTSGRTETAPGQPSGPDSGAHAAPPAELPSAPNF